MAECTAEIRLPHGWFPGQAKTYLTCDLDAGDAHAGLNHHDGVYGLWWSRCDLDEHGHGGAGQAAVRS